jgi:two-component system, OmpR family, sensor histidine kinase MprB
MSFRRRLTLAGTAAVAVAILLASAIAFGVVRGELRGQVDDSLRSGADEVGGGIIVVRGAAPALGDEIMKVAPKSRDEVQQQVVPPDEVQLFKQQLVAPAPLTGPTRYAQLVNANGDVLRQPDGGTRLPVTPEARRVAARGTGSFFDDQTVDGVHVRVYTRAIGDRQALQLARPVDEVDSAINRLAWILGGVGVGGVGLAAALGLVVTRTATRPLRELSDAADHVARTRDLSRRIDAGGDDDLSRLASSFNTMLEALERSMAAQRQLVADASHELRTPLTSVRTNIEVLASSNGMPEDERERVLTSTTQQLEELSRVVGDLVDLARDRDAAEEPSEPVRLDMLVSEAVERARRLNPDREFEASLEPSVVTAAPGRLDRAVWNLLDNAAKWSPPGEAVEVSARDGTVTVRDHGPGIDSSDLPHVFDRFYRAPSARGTPGSGLGLAIVKQVADTYGGEVSVDSAGGAGTTARLRLPVASATRS